MRQHGVVETPKKSPRARIVTRDFSKTYKNAIKEALSNAEPIVDRSYILKIRQRFWPHRLSQYQKMRMYEKRWDLD